MTSDIPLPAGVPTKTVLLRRGAIRDLPAVLRGLGLPPGAICGLLCDARTFAAAGKLVEATLEAGGFRPRRHVLLDDRPDEVTGTQAQLYEAAGVAMVCDVLIGVGSGVLNDLGKLAAKRMEKPYVAVATAASMNGYGSPIAAFIEGGVKRTLPAAPTQAIVADLDALAAAPIEMTRSGFADLLSKASATADWNLAHLVRDEAYDPRPHELLDPVVRQCQRQAAAIGRAEPDALKLLMQGLIYGAFAMTLAGHSAPASGGEHLISHLWDMHAHAAGGRHHLHGFQVAIGTRVAAALYERLMAMDADAIDVDALAERWRPWEEVCPGLRAAHGPLFEAVEPEAKKQHPTREQLRAELTLIRDRWDAIRDRIRPLLLSPARLIELHEAAGVPLDPAAVGQSRASVRHAMLHAKDVRARFTVLDLASELGVLEPWADDVLDAAGIRERGDGV